MSFYPHREVNDLPLFRSGRGASDAGLPPSAGVLQEELKRDGLARAEARDHDLAERLRFEARRIAHARGRVSIDDIRDYAEANGLVAPSPSFWGAIFSGPGWVRIGFENSRRPGKRAHCQSVWTVRRGVST